MAKLGGFNKGRQRRKTKKKRKKARRRGKGNLLTVNIKKDYRRLNELPPSVQYVGSEIAKQVVEIDGLPKHVAIEDVVNSYYYDKQQWKVYNNRRNDLITIGHKMEKPSSDLAKKIQRLRVHNGYIFGDEKKGEGGEIKTRKRKTKRKTKKKTKRKTKKKTKRKTSNYSL